MPCPAAFTGLWGRGCAFCVAVPRCRAVLGAAALQQRPGERLLVPNITPTYPLFQGSLVQTQIRSR